MVTNAGFIDFQITWSADIFSGTPQGSNAEFFATKGINLYAYKPRARGKAQKGTIPAQGAEGLQPTHLRRKEHWDNVYKDKLPTQVSWYEDYPEISLSLIKSTGVGPSGSIIDVGGGASKLVDTLLLHGYEDITVLDISTYALDRAKQRLKEQAADRVNWIEVDITLVKLEQTYDVWHDRAVFHFITDAGERRKYVETLRHSLKIGGHLIVATFAIDGPLRCSGLDIVRYSSQGLHNEFGADFELVESFELDHITPAEKVQRFIFCHFRRMA
uniref:Hypothetical methylase protein n=1 Tax=uncultured Nitrospirae bacterium MY2-3C TaxID=798577 RepID=D9MNZ7_9BACT|nr:hypothetical methylase protein [uncultured Nitrospirae bacterium MY2-3C]